MLVVLSATIRFHIWPTNKICKGMMMQGFIPLPRATLFSMAFLVALVLMGCGPDEPEAPAAKPEIELRIIADNNRSPIADEVARRYEESNPTITLKNEAWGAWPRTYLEGEEPPDLLTIGPADWLFSVIDDNLVADITGIWEETTLSDTYPPELQVLTQRGGKHYFLPTGYGWFAVYYNRAVFQQYGLTPPDSWDDLMQIAETLVLNGETPFALPMGWEWNAAFWFDYINLRLNGPEFHRMLTNGEISFTDERVRNALATWQFLFDQGYFIQNGSVRSNMDMLGSIIRGDSKSPITRHKAVMALTSPDNLADFPLVFRNELGFFRFPIINPEIPTGELVATGGLIVSANAPNRLEAIEYMKFIVSPEIQEVVAQGVGSEDMFVPIQSDFDSLPTEVQDGAQIIQAADGLSLPIFWGTPVEMRVKLESGVSKFLRGITSDRVELDIDEILGTLEEARLTALTDGAFGTQ